ncbi:MAG: hypothetical protein IPP58_03470 [Holophagaceae bacterium]|uniref:Outer membrane protein beta-barrel domain-containing protein n=1 Tax=Candidatus Geothrix skivensis TaxID=2954439 RepID=A0A9D7SEQ0_9BACT|nr:hypothetical protein [Candidatus Geothrix skivensis]
MRTRMLALSLLATTGLWAQGVRVNGGLQAGLSLPTGDFADKKASDGNYLGANDGAGAHFGGHLDFNFTPHHQLRLMAQSNGFASKKQDTFSGGFYDGTRQNTFGVAQFGADYVFNAGSPSRGGYFLVGVNVNRVIAKAEFSFYGDSEVTQSGRPGLRIGGGYTFNRVFSLEGHLNSVSVEKNGIDGLGYDAITWLAVSAVFRFGR